jgi:hypothetical protein
MQRRTEEARGARCWTRFLGGSALALALALSGAARAEPASDSGAAVEDQAPVQSEARAAQASPTLGCPSSEGAMNSRGNCENDFTQNCFQQGAASRPPSGQPESYAQSHFQPAAAEPERE